MKSYVPVLLLAGMAAAAPIGSGEASAPSTDGYETKADKLWNGTIWLGKRSTTDEYETNANKAWNPVTWVVKRSATDEHETDANKAWNPVTWVVKRSAKENNDVDRWYSSFIWFKRSEDETNIDQE